MRKDGKNSFLDLVYTTTVSAITESFVTSDKFVIGNEANIVFVTDQFEEMFGLEIEPPIIGRQLQCYKLLRQATDFIGKHGRRTIIQELGGEVKAETTLGAIYQLMIRFANGEKNLLLADGYFNIFYVRNIFGLLWSVNVVRDTAGDGWCVDADSGPTMCVCFRNKGCRVFSHSDS